MHLTIEANLRLGLAGILCSSSVPFVRAGARADPRHPRPTFRSDRPTSTDTSSTLPPSQTRSTRTTLRTARQRATRRSKLPRSISAYFCKRPPNCLSLLTPKSYGPAPAREDHIRPERRPTRAGGVTFRRDHGNAANPKQVSTLQKNACRW
jgi:hypothetical protein